MKLEEYAQSGAPHGFVLMPELEAFGKVLKAEFPKGADKKQLSLTDERIFDLVRKLGDDMPGETRFAFCCHSLIAFSWITEVRNKGAKFPEEYRLGYEDRFAVCGKEIEMLIEARDKVAARIKDTVGALEQNNADHVTMAQAADLLNQHSIIIGRLAPFIGQLNEFSEKLSLCSHSFGKVSAKAEDITFEDLLGVLKPERERLEKQN